MPNMTKTLEEDVAKFVSKGEHIEEFWHPYDLWPDKSHNGLCKYTNGKWGMVSISGTEMKVTIPSPKSEFLDVDIKWQESFDRAENGIVKPSWVRRKCSCGAEAVYGKNCPGHSSYCLLSDASYVGPSVPKNNDGRDICYKCSKPTVEQAYWNNIYNLCDNPKC